MRSYAKMTNKELNYYAYKQTVSYLDKNIGECELSSLSDTILSIAWHRYGKGFHGVPIELKSRGYELKQYNYGTTDGFYEELYLWTYNSSYEEFPSLRDKLDTEYLIPNYDNEYYEMRELNKEIDSLKNQLKMAKERMEDYKHKRNEPWQVDFRNEESNSFCFYSKYNVRCDYLDKSKTLMDYEIPF